ncbi:phage holin family protein [Ectobacillus antri]|jgi:putative membrane protein|uniref:Phage holin family protein n=1 Tax=Ectobacillus antri TaxID=2486280 RepID=A0ABT6H779_9BACI|nr:phage holin family protein [Ectobacillus antri]MDG4657164.1 phage holin family protein [Ectobacillus antri]MDG5754623.1 phage holin family protein [Ectobacillus antri]
MRWLLSIVLNAFVLIVVSGLLKLISPESFYIKSIGTALIASFTLSLLHMFVKPLLIIITLPLTIITFGFFLVIINAITLKLTDNLLGDAFNINGFGTAIVAAIFISVFNIFIDKLIFRAREKKE